MDDRFLEQALDLADAAGDRAHPKPTVGAVVVAANGEDRRPRRDRAGP